MLSHFRFSNRFSSGLHINFIVLRGLSGSIYSARQLLELHRLDVTIETKTELRSKYYLLAKQCHPDSAEVGFKNASRFAKLTEAYVLLSGRLDEIKRLSNDNAADHTDNVGSRKIWATMFYGNIEAEINISGDIIADILHTASLSRGGLDKGGLWELVESFAAQNARLQSSLTEDNSNGQYSNSQDNFNQEPIYQPKPFTRRK